jgi:PAS domain S-box-containing protein
MNLNRHALKKYSPNNLPGYVQYIGPALLVLAGLEILSAYDYLLFHTIAEIFSIVIAGCVFIISWNSRDNVDSSAIPLLGAAFLSIAVLDGLHALSYAGMPFFPQYGADLPTQLWIATRYLESFSLLAFTLLMGKRFSLRFTIPGYAAITVGIIVLVFTRIFPECYIPEKGLTGFKVAREYLISLLLLAAMAVIYKRRKIWDRLVYRLIMFSLVSTILAELAFTFYVSVYGLSNLIGHYFKIVSFYLIYRAVVTTGISQPQNLLFHRLKESEDRYNSLTRNLQGIIFRGNLDFGLIFIRGQVRKITGYEQEEFTAGRLTWKQVMHPDDLAEMIQSEEQKKLLTRTGYSLNREYRIYRKDGAMRWLSETIHNAPDSSGYPAYVEGVLLDITGKKRAEEAAARQANLLSSLLNAIQESAVLLDKNGRVLHANSTLCERWDVSADEVIGREFTAFLPDEAAAKRRETVSRVLNSGESAGFEETLSGRSMEHRFYPVKDSRTGETAGVTVLGVDITERKQRELELNKLRLSMENSPMSIVITDTQGTIEYVNPAFSSITGYTREEALGQNPRILKSGRHEDDFYREMWETVSSGKTWRGEIQNRKKNDQLYWEQAAIAPVTDEKNNVTNYVAVKEDITQKKNLERLKEDVERIMRHDLKSPLNGIIGLPRILEAEGNLTEEQVELVRSMEQSGRKMLNMINLSLDMFKMEMGSYVYQPQEVDVLAVIREIISDNKSRTAAADLKTRVFVDHGPPQANDGFVLFSEERLLYNMLSNLYLNAVEASPPNAEITLEITDSDPAVLTVSNSGTVPPDIRDIFFDKYITRGKRAGTGLGTYSAMLIAHTMGYDIDMHTSDVEETTRIMIYIPREKPEWDAG